MAESAHLYDLSGTVTSVIHHSGWIYRIQSDENAYTMICEKSRLREVRCDWNGRSIAVGDRVQFRLKGTTAYLPSGAHQEERLFVSMTEFAQLRPLPVVPEGYLGAVVSGEGYAFDGQPSAFASAPDSTGIPVTAVPVTGGAPVTVIPVAPSAGPVVTGVPVTGGAPVTAIDVSAPASMTVSSASRAQLIHVLRVQSVGKIYDLACAERNCTLQGERSAWAIRWRCVSRRKESMSRGRERWLSVALTFLRHTFPRRCHIKASLWRRVGTAARAKESLPL